jgi:polyisoprenoid-binding protein YceI
LRHKKRWLIGGLAALVVIAVAVGVAYFVFGDDAPAKPKLSASATTVANAAATLPQGTWQVQRGTGVFVGYRIKELFGGATIKRTAVGRTGDVNGTLTLAGNQLRDAVVTANVSTLQSDRAPRDNYIHTHGLESDQFPRATFRLTTPIALAASVKPGATKHTEATGTLTLHGVTKPVTATLDARWNGATIEVAGTAPITLADFDIEPPNTPIVSVDDHGSFELHLVFTH